MVRRFFTTLMTLAVCSCTHIDVKGLFVPTGVGVETRFEQSAKMNEDLMAAVVHAEENYTFYVATDPHIEETHDNLTIFNDAFRTNGDALFGVILGDCVNIPDNLSRYLEALSFDSEIHTCNPPLFHVLGNHDIYFNGWEHFKEKIGPSVFWFEVAFAGGKDLYISLDTANGTLGRKQNEWFRSFLKNNRSRYRHCTVLTHTNFFYTDNSQAGSGNMPIEECFSLIDFFQTQNVSLVLQGHDHYREEIVYGNVKYTIVGAIVDESDSPEYLRVKVGPEAIDLDWHILQSILQGNLFD